MRDFRDAAGFLRKLSKNVVRALFLASLVVAIHGLVAAVVHAAWEPSKVLGGYLILSACILPGTTVGTIQNTAAFYFYVLTCCWAVGLWCSVVVLGVSLMRAGLADDPRAVELIYRSLWSLGLHLAFILVLAVLARIAGIDLDPLPVRKDPKIATTPPDFEAELEDEYRQRRRHKK